MRIKPRPRCVRCGKARFDTEAEALDLIARKSRYAGFKTVPTRYYWSEKCGTYHVTSKPYRPEMDGNR